MTDKYIILKVVTGLVTYIATTFIIFITFLSKCYTMPDKVKVFIVGVFIGVIVPLIIVYWWFG